MLGAVAVVPAKVQAQRGFAARAPVRAAPRMAAPARPMVARPGIVRPGMVRPGMAPGGTRFVPGSRFGNQFFPNGRFHHHHHHFFFTSGCFGNPFCSGFANLYPYAYSYPYSFYPYGFLDYSMFGPDTGYTQQQQQPYTVVQQTYDDTALRDQIDQLTGEVEQLRQEEQARRAPPPSAQPATPTVLVFRDGRRMEIQNYAIAGQTLWVFNERQAKKYPLSELNLAATTAANEQRGVQFSAPYR